MRKAFLICGVFLLACSKPVDRQAVEICEHICGNNGGMQTVWSCGFPRSSKPDIPNECVCKDTATFHGFDAYDAWKKDNSE